MKNKLIAGWVLLVGLGFILGACGGEKSKPMTLYTCPMPQDSFFSDKPGKCPKCGMDLIPVPDSMALRRNVVKADTMTRVSGYTCPMHPQVHSDTAGSCPICGMKLEKVKPASEARSVSLNTLLQPVNQEVVANVPMVHMMKRAEDLELESYGFITYDTRRVGVIASNVSGRIEKLYVQYRYQQVLRGQKIMDIYSPELLTAQENLLFLLKNDPDNESMIQAARQKLLLLGMSRRQLDRVIATGKAAYSVSVYSQYSGHIHEAGGGSMNQSAIPEKLEGSLTTRELSIKEGMYVDKGHNIFSVYDPRRAWAVLNIFAGQAALVKTGDHVRISPEGSPNKEFRASISYIEPFYRSNSKTQTARVYFDNKDLNIPIGSQVKATVFAGYRSANWLPEEAVLSLGLDNIVFVRSGESFTARKIETGIVHKHLIQVLSGLKETEAVAANAQYLVDSESFIKAN